MSWLTLTVNADAPSADILSEALLEFGALSVDVHDADADTLAEQAIFGEPGEADAHFWPHNRVTALFPSEAPVESLLKEAAHAAGLPAISDYHIETLEDNDWVRLTQSQFDAIRISQRLWIVPTWHAPSDPQAINITLDPGLAFGTGSHPTTRLCLRWLDDHIKGGEAVLDYGCGSGILAIAALKLGAASAIGVDLDAQAVRASRANAAANQVPAQFFLADACPDKTTGHSTRLSKNDSQVAGYELSRGDVPQVRADIVVANILTNPLKLLAPLLAGATKQGGRIVLSGIVAEQADDVMKIYAQWFNLAAPILEEGWACLSGIKQ
ncbi:MAG: 50S ribosomal protein L11 methyltransferase [Gallionellaceae bacterium]